jgi:pyrimidine operon attenuation protein / uracil phosphoribosyltransferase
MSPKQILTEDDISRHLESMVHDILEDNTSHRNIVLVGIITRGATLAARMRDIIGKDYNVQVGYGELDTIPYRDDLVKDVLVDRSNMPDKIDGKDVILVDDVMSTGRTTRAAMDALMEWGRPKSVKCAVLIDRGHRELPISADYVGAMVPTSVKEQIRVKLSEVDGGKDGAYIIVK